MELRLQINNPDIEELLIKFVKQQKEDLREISFETLEFFIKTFRKKSNTQMDLNPKQSNSEFNDFQELSNISLEKIWDNDEDEIYDKFLK